MGDLIGLDGMADDVKDVKFFKTVGAAFVGLKKLRAKTTAGSFGAINIWYDDSGLYRAERCVNGRVVGKVMHKKQMPIANWLKINLPRIHEKRTSAEGE